ncbi:MAG: iron-sulfur cluster assembly protein, partial [Myxococcales bacterium]|nr:iron-sulfur cluster assembly protein [Myxococcales bacterium]
MAVTKEQVLAALRAVQDPDLRRDIVTLGFVKGLEIAGGSVRFKVELTTPACP